MTTSPSLLPSSAIALVTGANKGIGLEVARQLAQQGLTVLVGARDRLRGEAAAARLQAEGLRAEFLHLDVADDASVTAAAAEVKARYGRLDVLVNNAGVQLEQQPSSLVAMQVLQDTFDINVFGVVRVTQAMLPLLRAAGTARIVNMGSALGSLTLTSDPDNMRSGVRLLAYATSKAALNAVTVQFANELRAEGIRVNAADPGYVATDLSGQQGFNSAEDGALPAVRLALLQPGGPTAGFFNIDGPVPW
ncbi:SDR family oxidoreductase [Deinococcus altitudinis]|uniref:SDR family oxidoreductase n=1 Tax=Deinococcus altitudinis TaxID=468914 RepID=UPI0038917EBB